MSLDKPAAIPVDTHMFQVSMSQNLFFFVADAFMTQANKLECLSLASLFISA
jgi:hypothetical protein